MSRIRTIKPSFFRDLAITGLPIPTRLTFIGLWTYVDDEGRGVDDARLVKAELWPLDDSYTVRKVETDLKCLAAAGRICRYTVLTERFLHVVHFKQHQRVNRPYASLIGPCPISEHSVNAQGALSDRSPPEKEKEKERRRRGERSVNERTSPPGKTALPPSPIAVAERKAVDLAKAAACGKCDHGWLTNDNGLVRCACQNGSRP